MSIESGQTAIQCSNIITFRVYYFSPVFQIHVFEGRTSSRDFAMDADIFAKYVSREFLLFLIISRIFIAHDSLICWLSLLFISSRLSPAGFLVTIKVVLPV